MIRVGLNRRVTFRYLMKNSSGEIIADTMDTKGVNFVFGSGEILPGLENELDGLKIGEGKTFSVSADAVRGLGDTFQFDVVIDDICWAKDAHPVGSPSVKGSLCGPDCACHAS